jgi:hypothetical protein
MRLTMVVVGFGAVFCLSGCGKKGTVTSPNVPLASRFVIETVDVNPIFGGASLALDAAGQPHAAYMGPAGVKYSARDTNGWHVETAVVQSNITATSLIMIWGYFPLITFVDNSGHLCFAYVKGNGQPWDVEIVDAFAGFGWVPSDLAIDTSGEPWITYLNSNRYLMRARRTYINNSWFIGVWTTGEELGVTASYMSFVLDAQDNRHIAYKDWTDTGGHSNDNGDLRYMTTSSGATVDTVGNTGYRTSIAIDAQGQPKICYLQGNGDLKLASESAGTWTVETITRTAPVQYPDDGARISLKVDAAGNPRVLFQDAVGPATLYYAAKDAGVWKIEPVAGVVSSPEALVLDSQGAPHILFSAGGALKYATLP